METFLKIFIIYNSIILGFLIILFISFLINLKHFKPVFSYKFNYLYRQTLPKISVLVPARNESKNIGKCLTSLLVQDYLNLEIIVLDDNSTDNTYNIVKKIIEDYNSKFPSSQRDNSEIAKISVKLLPGQPLNDGWVGKNFACYQLEKAATGDYLLFTDADTIHSPESVSCGLQCLLSNRLDALSVYPEMILDSFIEKMVIGFLKFGLLLFLPLYLRNRVKMPLFSMALGSYMFYKRSIYKSIGGHASVYNRCLEDMNMANLLKSNGYRFAIFDGYKTYKTRMYNNFTDIYKGFSRFVLTTFNYRKVPPLVVNIIISILLLLPFLQILIFPFIDSGIISALNTIPVPLSLVHGALILNLFQISLLLIIKTIYISRFEGNITDVVLHPVSIGIILLMGIKIFTGGKKTSSINWKGREYILNKSNSK